MLRSCSSPPDELRRTEPVRSAKRLKAASDGLSNMKEPRFTRYILRPGAKLRLDDWDPSAKAGFDRKKGDGFKELQGLCKSLELLQELLYAEHKHSLLIVLQGMDASGKDGTIRRVFEGVNPQGVRVEKFGPPTPEEARPRLSVEGAPEGPRKRGGRDIQSEPL